MKNRFIALTLLATATLSSCSRTTDAGLAGKEPPEKRENPKPSPSRPVTEETLKKLRTEVILDQDFAKNLEAAFAVHLMEKAMNGAFKVEIGKEKTDLLRHLGVDQNADNSSHRFGTSSVPYGVFAALVGMSSAAAMDKVAEKSVGPGKGGGLMFVMDEVARKMKRTSVRSAFASGALIAIPSVLLMRTAFFEKIGLSPAEQETVTRQLKSGKFPNAMKEVFRFLQLAPEDARDLEASFVKAVVAVYDRAFVDSVKEVAANDFFMRLDKEVNFFKIAKEFKPKHETIGYQERLEFLEKVHQGLEELPETNVENVSAKDAIELRLSVFKAYQEAIKSFENDSKLRKEESFQKAKNAIDERVATLEELNKEK